MIDFTFHGKSAMQDFGLRIESSNHETQAPKRYESIPIEGRTGNLLIDNGDFDNYTIEVVAIVDISPFNGQQFGYKVKQWLQGAIGYQRLLFNDGYEFEAICTNQIDIEKVLGNFRRIKINFEIKAVK